MYAHVSDNTKYIYIYMILALFYLICQIGLKNLQFVKPLLHLVHISIMLLFK